MKMKVDVNYFDAILDMYKSVALASSLPSLRLNVEVTFTRLQCRKL